MAFGDSKHLDGPPPQMSGKYDAPSPQMSGKYNDFSDPFSSANNSGNDYSKYDPYLLAGMGVLGQAYTNNSNQKMAREQMDFQRDMSNTSYQRGMEDMRLAGMNPFLASRVGGASTPQGSTSMMQNDIGGALSNASEIMTAKANIDLTKANAETVKARLPAVKAQSDFNASIDTLKNKALQAGVSGANTAYGKVKDALVSYSFNHNKKMTDGNKKISKLLNMVSSRNR